MDQDRQTETERDRPRQTERWTEGHIRMGSDRQTDGLSDRQTER